MFDLDQSPGTWLRDAGNEAPEVSMNNIAHWHAEHANFSRLLDILQKELDAFHLDAQPNYDLMVDIVSYLRHFPDVHHHPREDVMFSCMAKRDPSLGIALERLRQEHRVIAAAGEELLKTLNEVTSGAVIARSVVESIAAMYLVYYRHHITAEEEEVLPRATRLLSAGDWREVQAAGPAGRDPLFGDKAEAGYRELRRHIAIEAR